MRSTYVDKKEQKLFSSKVKEKISEHESHINKLTFKQNNGTTHSIIVRLRSLNMNLQHLSNELKIMETGDFQSNKEYLEKILVNDSGIYNATKRSALLHTWIDQVDFSKATLRFFSTKAIKQLTHLQRLTASALSETSQEVINEVTSFMNTYKIPLKREPLILIEENQSDAAVDFLSKPIAQLSKPDKLKQFFDFCTEENISNLSMVKSTIHQVILDFELNYPYKGARKHLTDYLLHNGVRLDE